MLLNFKQVMKLLNVNKSKAYKCMRELNAELQKDGYLTISGRIPADYLIKRYNLSLDDLEIIKKDLLHAW